MKVLLRIFISASLLSAIFVDALAPTPVQVIYEAGALAKSKFPIAPHDLIQRSKEILGPDIGVGTKDDGACLADNF